MTSVTTAFRLCIVVIHVITRASISLSVAPHTHDGTILYSITEELQRRNDVIGNLVHDAPNFDAIHRNNSAIIAQLKYSFLPQSSSFRNRFYVQNSTGLLRVARSVNRDVICPLAVDCEIDLNIRVEPPFFHVIKVKITVIDVNDEAPTFPSGEIIQSISEASVPGASFTIPAAQDNDSPRFSVRQYRLETERDTFELKVKTNSDGTSDIRLELLKRVDREKQAKYDCRVVAVDGGKFPRGPLVGEVMVRVLISDVNDANPTFSNDSYEVSIDENTKLETNIIRLVAHDADTGPNGLIRYSFDLETRQKYGQSFGINRTTGSVFVRRRLRFHDHAVYRLTVVATDQGDEPLTARTKLTVYIRDINDNAPQVKVHNSVQGAVALSEYTQPGDFVTHFSVFDDDAGRNGEFNCSLRPPAGSAVTSSSDFILNQLYRTEFKILANSAFDRETKARYVTTIVCKDFGQPQLSSTQTLTINIKDENDRTPVFGRELYTAAVVENRPPKSYVMRVSATDADEGLNAAIKYSFVQPNKHFNIDRNNGTITTAQLLDFEKVRDVTLDVIARDQGQPALSATARVMIKVLDEDDEQPRFEQRVYNLAVYENEAASTRVGQLAAVDRDSAKYNKFSLHIVEKEAQKYFSLEGSSGELYTKQKLDREDRSFYEFSASAVSSLKPEHSDTTLVRVYILDRNDHSPVVSFPNARNNTVHVWSHVTVGTSIVRVLVYDADQGDNARLRFSVLSGNERGVFKLDEDTGELIVARQLRVVEDQVFGLVIRVSDRGDVPRVTESIMNVIVNKSRTSYGFGDAFSTNWTVVISVICASAIVICALVIAIVIVLRNQREYSEHRLNMIKVEESNNSCSESPATKYTADNNVPRVGKSGGRERGFCYNGVDLTADVRSISIDHQEATSTANGSKVGFVNQSLLPEPAPPTSNSAAEKGKELAARQTSLPSATVRPFVYDPAGFHLPPRDYNASQRLLQSGSFYKRSNSAAAKASSSAKSQNHVTNGRTGHAPPPACVAPGGDAEVDSLSNTDSGRGSNDDNSETPRGPDSPAAALQLQQNGGRQGRSAHRVLLLEPHLLDEKRRILYEAHGQAQPYLSSHV